ncbi:MAG: SBBP repeat-containing protein [Bacteroidota bacterium]
MSVWTQGAALGWSTYLGGPDMDDSRAMAVDQNGHIYVLGSTEGTLPNISPTAQQPNPIGGGDAYLVKLSATGELVWGTYVGGERSDDAKSLAVAPNGDVLVLLTTSSQTLLSTADVYQPNYGGGFSDAFLARYTSEGQKIWGTYLGGDNNDIGFDLVTDNAGNAYAVGRTKSFNHVASPDAFQTEIAGDIDAFIYKIDPDGQRVWSTYFGGSRVDLGTAVATDLAQNVYLAGWTASETNFSTGGQQASYGGGQADMFIAKFRPDGQRDWCTYFGGVNNDFANDLAYNPDGSLIIVGSSFSPENISTPDTHQPYSDGSGEAVIAKFSLNGQRLWGSYFGGEDPDVFSEVNIAANGHLYVSGYARSEEEISTPCAPQEFHGEGIWDATLSVFGTAGRLRWSTYLGGSGEDQAYDVAISPDNDAVYFAGITKSSQNLSTPEAQQANFGGGDSDGFVARFDLCVPPVVALVDDGYICANQPENLIVDLLEGQCTFLAYALDGEPQELVRIESGRNTIELPENGWERVDLLSVGSAYCPGEIIGPNFIELALETLLPSEVVVQCDSASETYTAVFRLSGRSESFVELDGRGSFTGDLFTSYPIPFGASYSFRVSSTAACEILTINGQFECSPACPTLDLNLANDYQACIDDLFMLGPFPSENFPALGNQVDFRWSGPNNFRSESNQLLIENLNNSHAGSYQLVVSHAVVCTDSFAFQLRLDEKPLWSWDFQREPDCQRETADITLVSNQGNTQYSVDGSPYQTDPTFTNLDPGDHQIAVINEMGCMASDVIGWEKPLCPIYAPTAFSPNDDGINDRFRLFADFGQTIQIKRLEIFDRWGGSINRCVDLSVDDSTGWWNGNMPDGRPAAMGSYIWMAELMTASGQEILQSGIVNLLR